LRLGDKTLFFYLVKQSHPQRSDVISAQPEIAALAQKENAIVYILAG
jgi:hypothetical protein